MVKDGDKRKDYYDKYHINGDEELVVDIKGEETREIRSAFGLCSADLVCIENQLFILGIGPILD